MMHLNDEELVLHYYGEDGGAAANHLADCGACRENLSALQAVLNAVSEAPVPERPAEYGKQVWRRIAWKLGNYRWYAWAPLAAALLIAAFLAGRVSQRVEAPVDARNNQVRERILLVAVGTHLGRSQMVLAELGNATGGKGKTDISAERELASDLIDDNRLYRQTAQRAGDAKLASVLDDLERVLIEIANSPSEVSGDQLENLRKEILDRGLMFKVRVVEGQVEQRELAHKL